MGKSVLHQSAPSPGFAGYFPINGEERSSSVGPIPRLRRVLPHKWGRVFFHQTRIAFRKASDFRRRSRWCSSCDCRTPSIEAIKEASSFTRRYVSRSPDAIRRSTLIAATGTRSMAGKAHEEHSNPPAEGLNAAGLAGNGRSHDPPEISLGPEP